MAGKVKRPTGRRWGGPWPRDSAPAVGWWLLVACGLVVAMVILGGLTRLTHSGLSMVEWEPQRLLPPLNHHQWEEEFARYRQSPEFLHVNIDMDLAGFREIFWLEYIHRVVGRLLGVVLLVPLVWFLLRRAISRAMAMRLVGVLALLALQGLIGWLMVKSGLVDRPDVSHYRLALHLLAAFALLGWMLWLALTILLPANAQVGSPRGVRWLRWALGATGGLMLATTTWGAFVAGLDAGFIYNRFPLMGDRPWPNGVGRDGLLEALVENPGVVQFVHRLLASATVIAALTVLALALRADLSGARRACALAVPAVAATQFALGVATVVEVVPTPLAAIHQSGALTLFAATILALAAVRDGRPETAGPPLTVPPAVTPVGSTSADGAPAG